MDERLRGISDRIEVWRGRLTAEYMKAGKVTPKVMFLSMRMQRLICLYYRTIMASGGGRDLGVLLLLSTGCLVDLGLAY